MAKGGLTNQDRLLQFMRQTQMQASSSFYLPPASPISPNAALLPSAPMTMMQLPGAMPGFSLGVPPPMLGQILGGPMGQAATMMFGGAIGNFVSANGRFLPGPMFGRANLFDHMRNQALMQSMQQSINLSRAPDVASTSMFLGNMAIAMKGTTDPAEIASLRATAGKAAENMMGVMAPFIPMIAGSPQIRQMADSIGLTRMLGTQIAAARISMAEKGPFTPFGADPTQVAGVATGIANYFAPGGVENLLRSRGFNVAEMGDLYAGLATRGLLPSMPAPGAAGGVAAQSLAAGQIGPPIPEDSRGFPLAQGGRLAAGVGAGKQGDINRKLESYARAVELVAQVMGPNAPMEKLLQGLEKITGGGLTQLDPAKLERQVLSFQETANFANVSTDLLMNVTQQGSVFAGQMGINTVIGAPTGALALRIEAADRQLRRSSGGGPEFGRPLEGDRVANLQRAAVGGAASTVGKTAAGLQAMARTLGGGDLEKGKQMLPPELRQALEDFNSTDTERQVNAARVFSSPSLVMSALSKSTGMSMGLISQAMENPNYYGEEQNEAFTNHMLRLQASESADQIARGLTGDAGSIITKLGIHLNKGETAEDFARSLVLASFDANTREEGTEDIQRILESRAGQNVGDAAAIAGVFGSAIGTRAFRVGGKGAETRIRQLLGSGQLKADKMFKSTLAVRGALNETIYGKTSAGGMGGYVGNLIRAVQSADPTTLSVSDLTRYALGGVPVDIAMSSQVKALAGKYGISLENQDGSERDPQDVVGELGAKILEEANNTDDPKLKQQILEDYKAVMGAGSGIGFGQVLDAAELMAVKNISDREDLTDEEKKSLTKETIATSQRIRKVAGQLSTEEVAAGVSRAGISKRLHALERTRDVALKKSKDVQTAGTAASLAITGAIRGVFADDDMIKLKPELEASLSDEQKAKLKKMAGGLKKARQRAAILSGDEQKGRDIEEDDRKRIESVFDQVKALEEVVRPEEMEGDKGGEKEDKPERKKSEESSIIKDRTDAREKRKISEDVLKRKAEDKRSEHDEPVVSSGNPKGTVGDPVYVIAMVPGNEPVNTGPLASEHA